MDNLVGHAVANTAFRIERHLQGEGWQQLYAGSDRTLIATDLTPSSSKFDDTALKTFRRTLEYKHPGIFELDYVGQLDRERWALVERVTPGEWLPSFLGTYPSHMLYQDESAPLPSHDAQNALRNSLSLGRSVGRILANAARNGTVLAYVRPELIWADRVNDTLVATGLSARAPALFSRTTVDAGSLPVFDRHYFAPEAYRQDVDDRALTFSLAIMIAEWAMGRFPYKFKSYGFVHEGKHLGLRPMPKALAKLLSRGMRRSRDERPGLAEFLAALEHPY